MLENENRAVAEACEQQTEDRRAEPFRHPQDAEAEPTTHPKYRNELSTVYLLGVSLSLTTIRGGAADTCKGLMARATKTEP